MLQANSLVPENKSRQNSIGKPLILFILLYLPCWYESKEVMPLVDTWASVLAISCLSKAKLEETAMECTTLELLGLVENNIPLSSINPPMHASTMTIHVCNDASTITIHVCNDASPMNIHVCNDVSSMTIHPSIHPSITNDYLYILEHPCMQWCITNDHPCMHHHPWCTNECITIHGLCPYYLQSM